MARIDEQDLDEKRLARRQRRKRSQLIAYIILVSFCVLVIAASGLLIHFISSKVKDRRVSTQEAEQTAEQLPEEESAVIETPEESPTVVEYTEEDLLSEVIDDVLATQTLEDKVAGLFILTPEQLTGVETAVKAGSGTEEALRQYAIGGMTYSAKNIKSADQIKEMLDTISSNLTKYPLFMILSDQAGASDAVAETLGYSTDIELSDQDAAYQAASGMGAELSKNGFNFALCPSMDMESEEGEADLDKLKGVSLGFAKGLKESGITACPYMFPLKGDTLSGMDVDEISRDDLVVGQYELFKNLIDEDCCSAIMVSNISLPTVAGDNTPACLSYAIVTDELRETLGFDGVVITSPLTEGAVTEYYTSAEAAEAAIKAGADMIYMPENFTEAYEGLLESVSSGHITEERIDESLRRIYRIKYEGRTGQSSGSN